MASTHDSDTSERLKKASRDLAIAADRLLDVLYRRNEPAIPPYPGRIVSATFSKSRRRRARAVFDDIAFASAQTDIALLIVLAKAGGRPLSAGAIARAVGALRGDKAPPPEAIATYVSRVRGLLAQVRADGAELLEGDEKSGWRLVMDADATVNAPDWKTEPS